MQVRDLQELLNEYPPEWPVCYKTKAGDAVPIVVERGRGRVCPTGTRTKDGGYRDAQSQFVGIKCAPVLDVKPDFPKIGDRPKAPEPAVGQLWSYSHYWTGKPLHIRLNLEVDVHGNVGYFGTNTAGIRTLTYGTLAALMKDIVGDLTYVSG
jgi:hypothetical protein